MKTLVNCMFVCLSHFILFIYLFISMDLLANERENFSKKKNQQWFKQREFSVFFCIRQFWWVNLLLFWLWRNFPIWKCSTFGSPSERRLCGNRPCLISNVWIHRMRLFFFLETEKWYFHVFQSEFFRLEPS